MLKPTRDHDPGLQPVIAKNYIYCPVIPWIINKYNVVEPPSDSMIAGLEEHGGEGGQVRVRSSIGVAVLDGLVEDGDGLVIVERKAYRSRSIHRYLVQVLVQYMVASRRFHGIRWVRIVNGDRVYVFRVTDDMVGEAEMIIKRMGRSITSDRPPQPVTDRGRCIYCWYRRYCPYS